jgi:hypothetical protein
MDDETKRDAEPQGNEPTETLPPIWLRATLADLADLEFESPIGNSKSAESQELGELFRVAAGETDDTPATRVFRMLSAAAGMLFRPKNRSFCRRPPVARCCGFPRPARRNPVCHGWARDASLLASPPF